MAIDWPALQARREKVSESLSGGVEFLWDKGKITKIEGEGSLTADGNVSVGGEVYEAKAVVLATGSVALPIPGVEFGGRVVDTWGAWSLPEQPRKIAVVGAGASGSEIASAYARLGTEVILIEMLPQILPAEDKDIAKVVERVFKKQGIEISTGAPVENVEVGEGSVKFTYGDKSAEVDYLCVAGGRGPDTEGLGLEAAGVQLDEGGRKIKVDEFQRTTNPKVFAIGDLVNKKALAHKASEEGVVAVETAAGVETEPVNQELHGRRHLHPPAGGERRPHRGGRQGGGPRGEDRQTENLRRGCRHRLRRQRRDRQARRRRQIRRDPRCPHRRQPGLRHDRRAGRRDGARGRRPGGRPDRAPAPDGVSEAVLDAARAVDGWAIHA